MTVLITGGTGFIGAEVVRLLLERGEQRPVVFHVSSNTQRLGDVLDQVELVRGDLGNFNHIRASLLPSGRSLRRAARYSTSRMRRAP